MTAIRVDDLPSPLFTEHHSYDPSLSALATEASLPPRHVADHLMDVYFQYRTAHMPIIEKAQAGAALERAYLSSGRQPSDRQAEKDIFIAYMIFATPSAMFLTHLGAGQRRARVASGRQSVGLQRSSHIPQVTSRPSELYSYYASLFPYALLGEVYGI